jgi:hypothetical protein
MAAVLAKEATQDILPSGIPVADGILMSSLSGSDLEPNQIAPSLTRSPVLLAIQRFHHLRLWTQSTDRFCLKAGEGDAV